MQPFAYHLFVCDQQKPEGLPCCNARGSGAVIDALRRELGSRRLMDRVQLTVTGSLGLCERGPNMVVYPDGVWYSGVTPADVPEIVENHFIRGQAVSRLINRDEAALKAEITANRDRALAAMRAREASGALPDDLEQSIRGYQEGRVILTAIELDLFTAAAEDADAATIAKRAGTDSRATAMLLDALVALRLMTKEGGRYAPSAVAARFFTAGAPFDARAAMRHHTSLWERWSRLTDTVRRGTPPEFTELRDRDDNWTVAFIAAMHRNASMRAPTVVQALGTGRIGRLIDVGGGSGAYAIAFAKAHPELRVEVLDLPPVLAIADGHIRDAGVASQVTTRAGDLRSDTFGSDYDVVFASAICHMLCPDENRDLLRRSFAALAPGGRLVIQDFILDPDRTSPKHAALFSINMLVGTKGGSSYAEDEYASWMREAGFASIDRVRLPGPAGLMIGTRA